MIEPSITNFVETWGQLFFAAIVAISTVFYVILTSKLVKKTGGLVSETKKIREFQLTPDIHIYFQKADITHGIIFLIIENMGMGTAKDVQFEIIKDFQYYDYPDDELQNKALFKNGLNDFYPNQKFKYFITALDRENEEQTKEIIEISVHYKNILGRKQPPKKFILRIDEVMGQSTLIPLDSYIGRISVELNEIKQILNKNAPESLGFTKNKTKNNPIL